MFKRMNILYPTGFINSYSNFTFLWWNEHITFSFKICQDLNNLGSVKKYNGKKSKKGWN